MTARVAWAVAAAAALAGCGNGSGAALPVITKSVASRITTSQAESNARQDAVNAAVVADPEALRTFEAPILLVTVPQLNSVGIIGPLTQDGDESVWGSADDKTLAFRNGMVVASKGFGVDLQSADEPDVRRARGEVVRDHYYRDGDEVIRRQRFFCVIVDEGPAQAVFLGRIYPTKLVTEACKSDTDEFTNAYWLGSDGEFRLSRQWISDEVGYVHVHKVQD